MELTLKTEELQEMVSKAIKCSSNNKLIPLTSLMSIKVENNVLVLTTTDATNYFYTEKPEVLCDDFEVSVVAELFTRLVQKTTSSDTTLIVDGGIMKVKGNGTYTMELPLDENGSTIKFPTKYDRSAFRDDAGVIKKSTILNILAKNKASLSTSIELPALACYYCGDKVVTSDQYKICSTGIKMFDEPKLITAPMMELLGIVDNEDISVSTTKDDIVFTSGLDTIYAPITEGVDSFPIKPIEGLLDVEFNSSCKVPKTAILNVIDRLSLFVSPYDKRGIYLTFTKDGIMFSSKKSSGTELVPYISSDNFSEYTCCIDIEMLKTQIATQDVEAIDLYYGSEVAIKLVNGNITQIVALMEDDRVEVEG